MNQQAQAAAATQMPEEGKFQIRIEPKAIFPATTESAMMTSVELTEMVVRVMRTMLPDLEGGVIYPDATGVLRCTLYFKNKGINGGAVMPLATKTARDQKYTGSERIRNFNLSSQQRTLQLTDMAKDILSQVMTFDPKKGVDWNSRAVVTETVNTVYGQQHVLLQVSNIDINKFLKLYYGNIDEVTGGRIDYQAVLLRPVGQNMSGVTQNYLLNIIRLDNKYLEDTFAKIGFIATGGSVPMVTAL